MSASSEASASANARTKLANQATTLALASFTHDTRIEAAERHFRAKVAHNKAAERHADDGHVNKAAAHAAAARRHALLETTLRGGHSADRVQKIRGGHAVDLVPTALNEDLYKASRNLVDDTSLADVASASEHSYTPGAVIAMSDDDLQQIIRRGPAPRLSNPPLQEEYEQTAQYREAVEEKVRRDKGAPDSSAFTVPGRTAVQPQTGAPREKPGQMRPATSNAQTFTPLEAMTTEELQAIQDMSRTQRASDDAPVNHSPAREATSELFRRALDPATATPVNPTNWNT